MKLKFISLIVGIAAIPIVSTAQVQHLVIKKSDGTEVLKPLPVINKFGFVEQELVLDLKSNQKESYTLESLNKLYFNSKDTTASVNENNSQAIIIYPNPAMDKIYIKNINLPNIEISIYNLNGEKVQTAIIKSENEAISIDSLGSGVYFIKVGTYILRFEKL